MNVFMGCWPEVLQAMRERMPVDLVIVEDKPAGAPVRELAREAGIPLRLLARGDSPAEVLDGRARLVVVSSFGRLLTQAVIGRVDQIVNFHPGVIEVCRGRHPLPCAILHRHPWMGVTCHRITSEAIDAGPIVAQVRLPLDYDASYRQNEDRLRLAAGHLAGYVFDGYRRSGRFESREWTPSQQAYFPPLNASELGRVFSARPLSSLFAGRAVA